MDGAARNDPFASPERGKRLFHPEAELLDRAIREVDVAIQHDILDLLALRLAETALGTTQRGRETRAVNSLRDAARELGCSPSIKAYRKLRAERSDLDLVPDGHIRRWLGNVGWNQCLERAHLAVATEGDFTTRARGPAFSKDELERAAAACFSDLGGEAIPTWNEYVRWAAQPGVQAREDRIPRSPVPFQRLGGLTRILVEVGLVEETTWTRADGVRRPGKYAYSRRDHQEALQLVAARIGNRPPRPCEYRQERLRLQDPTRAGEEPRLIPCPTVIVKRYGSWAAALKDAGFDVDAPAGDEASFVLHPSGFRWTDDELLDLLRRAFDEIGLPFTRARFGQWRAAQVAKAEHDGSMVVLPEPPTIARRFGGWPAACERALGDRYTRTRRKPRAA